MDNFLNWTDEQIEELINDVYNGVVSKDNLPPALYNAILDRMTDAIIEGWNGDEDELYNSFVTNIKNFSFAKTFQQINDMTNFKFSDDGFVRLYSEFKKNASEIFEIYNKNWLETEYNTAINLVKSADEQREIEKNKDLFPLLKYQTVGDERVRNSHKKLDNIVARVGSEFWKENYPPNDWNCRCIAISLEEGEEEETDLESVEFKEVKGIFKNNPFVSGEVFREDIHPYFKGLGGRKNEF